LAPVTTATLPDWSGMSAVVQAILNATSTTHGSGRALLGEPPSTLPDQQPEPTLGGVELAAQPKECLEVAA
jgi:hypothetical protein